MKPSKSLLRHDFIGLHAKVVKSTHEGYVGISGIVAEETKNMLAISQGGKTRLVPKRVCVFHFTLPNGKVFEVNGKLIAYRPEDRIKKI